MTIRIYGGGTIIGLCEALRERIRGATETLRLETDDKHAPARSPVVINGFLPPKRSIDGPENPFVIVRPSEGRIPDDGFSRVSVSVIVGTYSEKFDGHEYALIIFQRIMQSLCENPTLANRYTLEYPLKWNLYDDQPYPFWQMVMTTEWVVPTPVMLPDEGVL